MFPNFRPYSAVGGRKLGMVYTLETGTHFKTVEGAFRATLRSVSVLGNIAWEKSVMAQEAANQGKRFPFGNRVKKSCLYNFPYVPSNK